PERRISYPGPSGEMSLDEKTTQHSHVRGHVLHVVPRETPTFFPHAAGPSAEKPDLSQFLPNPPRCLLLVDVDRRHHPLHQAAHRTQAGAVHQTTLPRRTSPRIWERVLHGTPVGQQHTLESLEIRGAGSDVPVREETTRRRRHAVLNHLHEGRIGDKCCL